MNILIKGLIIYILLAVAIRFMGKRQIGELQPAELIITMVLSEISTMPLQENMLPSPRSREMYLIWKWQF